jgi:hypothetical protein
MSGLWMIYYDDEPDYEGEEWGEVITDEKNDADVLADLILDEDILVEDEDE